MKPKFNVVNLQSVDHHHILVVTQNMAFKAVIQITS